VLHGHVAARDERDPGGRLAGKEQRRRDDAIDVAAGQQVEFPIIAISEFRDEASPAYNRFYLA